MSNKNNVLTVEVKATEIDEVKDIVTYEVENCLNRNILEWSVIKSKVKKSVDRYLYNKLKRGTSIFPIIVEV